MEKRFKADFNSYCPSHKGAGKRSRRARDGGEESLKIGWKLEHIDAATLMSVYSSGFIYQWRYNGGETDRDQYGRERGGRECCRLAKL